MLLNILSITLALLAVAVAYIKYQYQYWTRRNVPQLDPKFPKGNLSTGTTHSAITLAESYKVFKKHGAKYGGLYVFTKPMLLPIDLDLLKDIMTKDFQHFQDRGFNRDDDDTSLEANILELGGNHWRNLRNKLSPTFTSGKLKAMFATLAKCLEPMQNRLGKLQGSAVDIKEIVACYTTDVIGSCAFGIDCNSFDEQIESPFRKFGKIVFTQTFRDRFKRLLRMNYPMLSKLFNLSGVREDVDNFFRNVVKDTVEYREKNSVQRYDFMQLLIELKKQDLLKMHEIEAQSYVFFFAGFETSSTATTFTMYFLAKHQDIQDKVRHEIRTVLAKHNGQVSYEAIQEMKYLDQVLDETLRFYPPVPLVPRRCTQEYKVPNDTLTIEKGTLLMLNLYAIHHDDEYYPDPETFDPERFNDENRKSRHPYAYIPFGEGPRICIGLRFGLMQAKMALVGLLQDYKFTVNRKTQEPLVMVSDTQVFVAKGDIWLDIEKL